MLSKDEHETNEAHLKKLRRAASLLMLVLQERGLAVMQISRRRFTNLVTIIRNSLWPKTFLKPCETSKHRNSYTTHVYRMRRCYVD